MIYLIYGTNLEKARKKAVTLAQSLRAKKNDALYIKIDEENWSVSKLEECIQGQGLFVQKNIVYLDRVIDRGDADMIDTLLGYAKQMKESESIFIILETDLSKKHLDTIKKYAEKVEEHNVAEEAKGQYGAGDKAGKINIFALGDALGDRDKAKLWSLYRMGIDQGMTSEEMHGTLWWQLKSIYLASMTKSATEAGLAPFVYSKSKKYAGKYKKEDLEKMMDTLVDLPAQSRIKGRGLEVGLERWILGL